ncbi:MAG TPA: UDP-N-acetylmuramoyl-tripeptide--D-alanyl-D-alanine ligase, partial [Candidatus Sulfotelmatobacter sp.]|nr:UDP-N-acetylmuramoyl-tripeptide--D-alanyl-D-alanine ligase [Candidatus Sulfotelmatobacter sp.]
ILQLERYAPPRYAEWLRSHRRTVVPGQELGLHAVILGASGLLAGAGAPWPAGYALWLAGGHYLLARHRSLQVSQQLAGTPRLLRVAALAGLVSAVLLAWTVNLASLLLPGPSAWRLLLGAMVALAVAGTLAPAAVLLAGWVATPLERGLGRRFLSQAAARMRGYPGRVIGVTGSYGKTGTKLILADLLAEKYRVCKTPAGVNTTMGITRVIREDLQDAHEVFIVECSAYGPGEIQQVCDLVHPTLAILTAVGVQHLERFGTPERIAAAKYELLASLPPGGPAVINADDPGALALARRADVEGKRVLLYGMGDAPALALRGVDVGVGPRGSRFRAVTAGGESQAFETPLLGRWNLSNILGALTAALECGLPLAAMRRAVAALKPAPHRLEVHEEGGITRILDVANANPRGAAMALEVLGQFTAGRRILITPGMVELGALEADENRRFGRAAAGVCDYVVLVGPRQTQPIQDGLADAGFAAERIRVVRHADAVADALADIVRPGDVLLYENRLPDTYLEVGT